MAWTKRQQTLAHIAAGKAGWTDARRRIAMLHVGCRPCGPDKRPSTRDPRNTQRQFEMFMELAEADALIAGRGDEFPRAGAGKLWRDVISRDTTRTIRMIVSIWEEAEVRMPDRFAADGLEGFVAHMTKLADPSLPGVHVGSDLGACDAAQLYAILEGLKAWVGREMRARGLTPRTFVSRTTQRAVDGPSNTA